MLELKLQQRNLPPLYCSHEGCRKKDVKTIHIYRATNAKHYLTDEDEQNVMNNIYFCC